MPLIFTPHVDDPEYIHGKFIMGNSNGGSMEILIYNRFDNGFEGETRETQLNRIHNMLNGKNDRAIFSNCNGTSEFRINFDLDTFLLNGGSFGPSFGSHCSIKCSYSKNKLEINKFLNFMLINDDSSENNLQDIKTKTNTNSENNININNHALDNNK